MPTETTDASGTLTATIEQPLLGQNALVTGGGRGLGATISARLARAGARLVITGRDGAALQRQAEQLPDDTVVVAGDLSHPSGPGQVLAGALEQMGRLDVLVNNAGVFHAGPSEELTAEEIDGLLAVNARGPLLLASAAAAPGGACTQPARARSTPSPARWRQSGGRAGCASTPCAQVSCARKPPGS